MGSCVHMRANVRFPREMNTRAPVWPPFGRRSGRCFTLTFIRVMPIGQVPDNVFDKILQLTDFDGDGSVGFASTARTAARALVRTCKSCPCVCPLTTRSLTLLVDQLCGIRPPDHR